MSLEARARLDKIEPGSMGKRTCCYDLMPIQLACFNDELQDRSGTCLFPQLSQFRSYC